jgi:hypothetical protein
MLAPMGFERNALHRQEHGGRVGSKNVLIDRKYFAI